MFTNFGFHWAQNCILQKNYLTIPKRLAYLQILELFTFIKIVLYFNNFLWFNKNTEAHESRFVLTINYFKF